MWVHLSVFIWCCNNCLPIYTASNRRIKVSVVNTVRTSLGTFSVLLSALLEFLVFLEYTSATLHLYKPQDTTSLGKGQGTLHWGIR
jgi:hypothetical protein